MITLALTLMTLFQTGGILAAADRHPALDGKPSRVGVAVRVSGIVLPGSELEPALLDERSPLVMRVAAVYPHGTAFRYDLEYYGLEPGDYDLRKVLRRKDGSSTADLPRLPATIVAGLPPGQIIPHALESRTLPWLGGYRLLLTSAILAWIAVLAALVYPRRRRLPATMATAPGATLAQRLHPLVRAAMEGRVSPAELAQLERALIGYWRERLGLLDLPPQAALAQLRSHADAGPLINQLEIWLHRPTQEPVDVQALLTPYDELPADALSQPASAQEQPA